MMPAIDMSRIPVSAGAPLGKGQSHDPRRAALVAIRRELARRELCNFGEFVSGGGWWKAYAMHRVIADGLKNVLDYVVSGGKRGTQFLMLLTPPQHGKSWMVSRNFPAFALGKHPDLRFLEVSYGADLASDNSRAVRNIVLSAEYKEIFGSLSSREEPVQLSADSRSIAAWDLESPHRGGMVAAGNGGALSGRERGILLWDDPIKDHRSALSQGVRDDAWDFYVSVLRPRSLAAVLVMTHWHSDDPAGRIMKQMMSNPNSDQWEIIMLPGLSEARCYAMDEDEQRKKMLDGVYLPLHDPLGRADGEAVCPQIMSREEMLKIREQSDFYFTALYQQMPYLRDGGMFRREYFDVVDTTPKDVTARVMFWDRAGTRTGIGGDKFSGVLGSIDEHEHIYIEHVVARRGTPKTCTDAILDSGKKLYQRYGTFDIWHQQDPGTAGLDSAQTLNHVMAREGLVGHFETVTGSKPVRAEKFSTEAEAGHVHLVRGAWNLSFIEACVAFTGEEGNSDDEVDATSSMVNKLMERVRKPRQQSRSWRG